MRLSRTRSVHAYVSGSDFTSHSCGAESVFADFMEGCAAKCERAGAFCKRGRSIALSASGGFGALSAVEPTEAEKTKARRAQALLYVLMAVMIGVPVALYFLRFGGRS